MPYLRAEHVTAFRYRGGAVSSRNLVRMTPLEEPGQRVLAARLESDPPGSFSSFTDRYGNRATLVYIGTRHARATFRALCLVERTGTTETRTDGGPVEGLGGRLPPEVWEFLEESRYVAAAPEVEDEAERWRIEGPRTVVPLLDAMAYRFSTTFRYHPGVTDIQTPAAEVLRRREGVCQDFAHAMIAVLRTLGIPARYVSGYLLGEGASHAWVEAYAPGEGWRPYDPTHGGRVTLDYVTLARGRDYADVAPLEGQYMGHPADEMAATARVERLEPTDVEGVRAEIEAARPRRRKARR